MTSPTPQAMEALPELPEIAGVIVVGTQAMRGYTADQMRAYACTAVSAALAAAQAEQAMGEPVAWLKQTAYGHSLSLGPQPVDGHEPLFKRAALATRPSPTVEQEPVGHTSQRGLDYLKRDPQGHCSLVSTPDELFNIPVYTSPQPQDTDRIDAERGYKAALRLIAELPIPEQDNYMAANMRRIASNALAARAAKEQP